MCTFGCTRPHASTSRGRWIAAGTGALVAAGLGLIPHAAGAEPAYPLDGVTTPSFLDQILAPSQLLRSGPPPGEDAALSLLRKIDADQLRITGFIASRDGADARDYRLYLGVRYETELGSLAQVTSRAFYGAGTFAGFAPQGTALPEEVRASSSLPGNWFGADWKLQSQLFAHHSLTAGVEYRQQLASDLLALSELLGRRGVVDTEPPRRRIGLFTTDDVTLSKNLALKIRLRYGEDTTAAESVVAPRVEVVYHPGKDSTLSAVFDQEENAPLSRPLAYNPWAGTDALTDRFRNFELSYSKSLRQQSTLQLSAYRYDAEGLLAQPPDSSELLDSVNAELGTTGFKIGVEHRTRHGTHGRISYAWQETTDWRAGTLNGNLGQRLASMSVDFPIVPRRLRTSIELQYVDFVGSLLGDRDHDYVIGNLTVASGSLSQNTRITLGMHNLFDVRETGNPAQWLSFVPPDGRRVRIDLTRTL